MTDVSLILQAVEIMLIGMGVVIILLAVLVLCTHVMSVLLRKATPEAGQDSTLVNTVQKVPSTMRIAAVVAATEHHRQIRSRS